MSQNCFPTTPRSEKDPRIPRNEGTFDPNIKVGKDGVKVEVKASLAKSETSQVAPIKAKAFVGKGVEVGANAAAFEYKTDKDTINVAKVGGNCGVTNQGVNIGAEVKPIWVENTIGNAKVATGLNLDTGFKANGDGVDVSFLGFGFKAGDDGFGIKTPFFGFFSK